MFTPWRDIAWPRATMQWTARAMHALRTRGHTRPLGSGCCVAADDAITANE